MSKTSTTATASSRQERRKARTRTALVKAAVELISAGRAEQATIQEITDQADVGFGTFYNYFESKEQLFALASAEVLEHWGQAVDLAAVDLTDPVEVFAAKFRLSGRVGRTHPDLARFLTELGLEALARPDGLGPRARRDLLTAFEAGRLHAASAPVALGAVAGALISLLELQLSVSGGVEDVVVDQITADLLRMMGLPSGEADEIAARPLPEAHF